MIKINRNDLVRYIKETNEIGNKIEALYLYHITEEFQNNRYHSYIDPNIKLFYKQLDSNIDTKITRKAAENIAMRQNNYIIVFVDKIDGKSIVTIAISKQITDKYKANDIAKELCKNINGKGGGNSIFAQVGTRETFIDGELEIFIQEILFTNVRSC